MFLGVLRSGNTVLGELVVAVVLLLELPLAHSRRLLS